MYLRGEVQLEKAKVGELNTAKTGVSYYDRTFSDPVILVSTQQTQLWDQ